MGELAVERSGKIDFLREKRSSYDICSTMDMVKSVETRDSGSLDRNPVEFLDEPVISLRRLSDIAGSIENRTNLVCPHYRITCRGDVKAVCNGGCSDLSHLSHLLLQSHSFEDFLNLHFYLLVLWNGRRGLLRA